jgi:predicted phage-related endonuclease
MSRSKGKVETLPLTSIGGAVSKPSPSWPVPSGIETFDATDRAKWLQMRERDVTASAVGCLLGVHDYVTAFEYWALKSGKISEDPEETPAMKRGRLLEDDALQLAQEHRPGWKIEQPGLYFRDPTARIGGTPDAFAFCPERGRGILQVKTAEANIFRKKWLDQETREVMLPLWIACQAILEAHLTGAEWAAVAVMVVGNGLDLHIIDVPLNKKLVARIYAAAEGFWRRVEHDDPPAPDYGRDSRAIAALYADDNGAEIDLSGDDRALEILAQRTRLKEIESTGSAAEKERKALDAEIINLLGNAARGVMADGQVIEAKTVRRKAFSVEATSFRSMRIKDYASGSASSRRSGDRPQSGPTVEHFRTSF